MPEELWTEVRDIVQEAVIKTFSKKKKYKKTKWLSKEALPTAEKRRETKGKGEKARITHLNAEFQRKGRRDKKAFLIDQSKEIEENNRMGKTRCLQENERNQWDISCKDGRNHGISSVQSFSHVRPFATHGLQHVRLRCPSPTPGDCTNSCLSSR